MNTELFQKIHEVISPRPDLLRMHDWESIDGSGECGTTRCIAGWAVHLTTGEPLFHLVPDGDGLEMEHPSVLALSDRLGLGPLDRRNFEMIGARLLGLDTDTARVVFYDADDDRAREFVRLAAAGEDDAALGLLEV